MFVITPIIASCVAFGTVAVVRKGIDAMKARRAEAIVAAPVVVRPARRSFDDPEAMLPRKIDAAQTEELNAALVPKRAVRARAVQDDEVAAAAAMLAKAKGEQSLD